MEYAVTVIDVHDDDGVDFTARHQFRADAHLEARELAELFSEWVGTS